MTEDRRLRTVVHWQDTFSMPRYDTEEEWLQRAAHIRRRILLAAGLLPEPQRTPLNPIVTGRVERGGYSVENVAFETFPGFYGTGNLYRPLGATGRVPAILTPHGHWRDGRVGTPPENSAAARGVSFARQGYVAFAPDMVGYNDSRQIAGHRTFESPERWLWGLSALGLQLWNNVRALDFLCSLDDVDPKRIAATGESGGASQTFLLTAVDQRVRYVAPVCMLSAHYAGGCVCENAPGLRIELNNMEIVACAAPRPMMIVAATGDWTVNTPTIEYPAVRSVYELFGAADRLECVQLDAPHNYNLDSRQAVYGFLARHLDGQGQTVARPSNATFWTGPSEPLAEQPITDPVPPDQLRVFPPETPLPAGALPDDAALSLAFADLARRRLEASLPADRAELAAFRERYGPLMAETLAAALPSVDELNVQRRTVVQEEPYKIERLEIGVRQTGERLPAVMLAPASPRRPVLLLDGYGASRWIGADNTPSRLVQGLVGRGHTVLTADLFLTGAFQSPFGAAGRPAAENHFTGYNRADDAWRVQDVLTAVAGLSHLTGGNDVAIIATGRAGLWALLARALAPERITYLAADVDRFAWDEPADYLAKLALPHLLRAGGLTSATLLAAPAPLLLFNGAGQIPPALPKLYARLGASEALTVEENDLPEPALLDAVLPRLS